MRNKGMGRSWVQPAGPVRPHIIKLSPVDNLTAQVYCPPTIFFPLKPDTDPRQLYHDCARGLARYLYQCPHLCGKLLKDATGRFSIEVPPAPSAGASFEYHDHRNVAEMPSYSEFKMFNFPFTDGNRDGLASLRAKHFPSYTTGDPILLSRFNVIRGGIVLTTAIAHAAGDLVQCIELTKSWAKHTNAAANSRITQQPEPPLPLQVPAELLDRSPMMSHAQTEHDLNKLATRANNFTNWAMLDPGDPEQIAETINNIFPQARITAKDLAAMPEERLRKPSVSLWTFSKTSVDKLKLTAQQSLPANVRLSTMDCLTAFMWQRFYAAKWAPSEPGADSLPDVSRVLFAGSVRSRVSPPLPADYLPACVDLFSATVKTGSDGCITSTSAKALVEAAASIRSANNSWSEETFRHMLEVAQSHPISPGMVPKGPFDAFFTDHMRYRSALLEDWGPYLGRCEVFREPYLGRNLPISEITFFPRWDKDGYSMMVSAEEVVLERLKQDELLNVLASWDFTMENFVEKVARYRRQCRL